MVTLLNKTTVQTTTAGERLRLACATVLLLAQQNLPKPTGCKRTPHACRPNETVGSGDALFLHSGLQKLDRLPLTQDMGGSLNL
jgi:hypothetical protein